MTGFVLTRTVLQVIRRMAGRADKDVIALAAGCTVYKLEELCRQHSISLKLDADEPSEAR
jgi:hypothetical protein